jgi:hypothetical protein
MALTVEGISCHIASSLITFNYEGIGTINDYKVSVNHLVRVFSEPLKKSGLQKIYKSEQVIEGVKCVNEHLIPADVIVTELLRLNCNEGKKKLANAVKKYLIDTIVIVLVTDEEDKMLTPKYKSKMPDEYYEEGNSLFKDRWARYKKVGIYENINTEF